MIRLVLLLLPVSAKVVRSKVDEEVGQLVVDAAAEDLTFGTFEDAGITIEEAEGPTHGKKLSDHRYTRRGGKVPGCEHIVVDHSTMLALWVMDKKPLPESIQADEIVFKCRDGYSTDGNGPFELGQDNMHVTVKCNGQPGTREIVSCKPVRCEWDEAHPLFNRQDAFSPEGGIFDAFVLRTVAPVRVEYEDRNGDTYRVIHKAKKEWVPLMGGTAVSSSDPKSLFTKVHEYDADFAAGRTEFASNRFGNVRMPQSPEEMFAFGDDVHALRKAVKKCQDGTTIPKEHLNAAESEKEFCHNLLSKEAKEAGQTNLPKPFTPLEIQAKKIGSMGSQQMYGMLQRLSPCRPEQKECMTHYTWKGNVPGLKDKMRAMVFACWKLQKVMRQIVDDHAAVHESLADRLGHGTHLHLKVKDDLSYSFDGSTMAAHTRNIVLYCDATGGLRRGQWYVEKTESQNVLPEGPPTVAGELAPRYPATRPGEEEVVADCEHFRQQGGNPVETSGCQGFKKIIKKCADGTVIPEEHLYNEDSEKLFCKDHQGPDAGKHVVIVEEDEHYVELVVTHVRASPVVCRNLLQNPRVAVLQQAACPQVSDGQIEGTYAEELDGLEAEELEAALARLRERGHPCGLTGWGGLELRDSSRQLTPIPLGHFEPVTCARGYALNGNDMTIGEDGMLPAPQTDLVISCVIDPETKQAVAIQGEEQWGESPGKEPVFVEKPGLQCVPIQCLAPPEQLNHAVAGSGAAQRDRANECLGDEGAWYSYGCDLNIQCEEHFAFPSLDGDGEVLTAWTSRCHHETRLMTPHHGCVPLMCETPAVRNETGKDRVLIGKHAEILADTPIQSGTEYLLPCEEGLTTDGQPYSESNRAYVLTCVVHEGHAEDAMRQPHLECQNCRHVENEAHLSQEECHPVTCEVPEETDTLEVHLSAEYNGDVLPFGPTEGRITHVNYKTEALVRCKEGYELYRRRPGEDTATKVEDVSSHTWLPLGLCMTNGQMGNDPVMLHGQEHAAFALGSGAYHCEKKPDFCPPLWDLAGPTPTGDDHRTAFAARNNIKILSDPELLAGVRSIGGSFTFQCARSHKVGEGISPYYDCEEVNCVEYLHEITVTCVPNRDPEAKPGTQAHSGMYVFGNEASDIGFHHGEGEQAICVPQVCQVPNALNAAGSHGRSDAPGLIGTAAHGDELDDAFGDEWILFQDEATFGCGEELQLVHRKQFVDSHVAGKQCMKDDAPVHEGRNHERDPAGRVTLICGSGWITSFEESHDSACYDHCGAVLAEPSRAKWNDFLTTTCTGPDGPTECEEGVARHYECDKGQHCRENAMVSCAAMQRMKSLGGRPGVGVKVNHGQQDAVFHLQCEAPTEGDGDGEDIAMFHVQHAASPASTPINAPPLYQQLLQSCGKQLRVVWEGPDKHIADVCPLESLVEARQGTSGKRYTAKQAAAAGVEWAGMKSLGQIACEIEGEESKGKCFEAVRTGVGTGELYVTDCDEANVNQRFVFTSPQATAAKGSSGQLVSLMQPEVTGGEDAEAHLWCVEISEKLDGNAETVKMDYKLAWCATNHEADDRLFCRGDPEERASDRGLPACQTLRANMASNDAVEVDAFGGGFGGFGTFGAFNKSMTPTHKTPPANVFSYVQPKKYYLEVAGAWAAVMAAVSEQGKTLAIEEDPGSVMSLSGVNRYDATEESRVSVEAFFQSIDHPAARAVRVRNLQLFNGNQEGMRLNVEFRLQEFDSFNEAMQDEFFGAVNAAGFAHRRPPRNSPLVEQAACGDNEQCGFLYFLHKSTVFDPSGQSSGKRIHECVKTGAFPADACKFEMYMEAKNPTKKQRIMGNGVYQVCYSNDLSECEGM